MAPGVTNMVIFCGGANASFDAIFATMVEPAYTNILQFSCSWGGGTAADPTSETLFQQMQAQGQSFYNATGDKGAFAQGSATLPSDSPSITQVGGSSLTDGAAPGYAWVSESAWDDDSGATVSVANCVASSGGFSAYYPIPYWQTNVSYLNSTGTNQASTSWRNFPDVAMNAEENNEIIADDGSGGERLGRHQLRGAGVVWFHRVVEPATKAAQPRHGQTRRLSQPGPVCAGPATQCLHDLFPRCHRRQ